MPSVEILEKSIPLKFELLWDKLFQMVAGLSGKLSPVRVLSILLRINVSGSKPAGPGTAWENF